MLYCAKFILDYCWGCLLFWIVVNLFFLIFHILNFDAYMLISLNKQQKKLYLKLFTGGW